MINPLHYIQAHPHDTKKVIGIDYDQFQQLLCQAEQSHQQRQAEIEKRKIRINAKGGGQQKILSNAEGVCLCLVYLRQHSTFMMLGIQFGVSKTTANDTFHYWLDIIADLLPPSLLEQTKRQGDDLEELQKFLEKHRLLIDSTEQQRERPGDNQEQKRFYSGKQKSHTFKNQIISLPEGKDIVDIIVGECGPESDINLFRKQRNNLSSQQEYEGDKAYVGDAKITTPHKKPRNGKLTDKQKEENKLLSSKRIFIEHLNRLLKIFRVAKEQFRLSSKNYRKAIRAVFGLVRLRIGAINLSTL